MLTGCIFRAYHPPALADDTCKLTNPGSISVRQISVPARPTLHLHPGYPRCTNCDIRGLALRGVPCLVTSNERPVSRRRTTTSRSTRRQRKRLLTILSGVSRDGRRHSLDVQATSTFDAAHLSGSWRPKRNAPWACRSRRWPPFLRWWPTARSTVSRVRPSRSG